MVANLRLAAGSRGLLRLKNLISVSNFDQPLQQQSISHLRADIAVLARAVALKEILALPAIIFDFHCGHKVEHLLVTALLPNRLKPSVTC